MNERFKETIDFADYSVIIDNKSLTYVFQTEKFGSYFVPLPYFNITIEKKEDTVINININYKDNWDSKMTFIWWAGSDLKGMFDFIARGYNIKLKNTKQ